MNSLKVEEINYVANIVQVTSRLYETTVQLVESAKSLLNKTSQLGQK